MEELRNKFREACAYYSALAEAAKGDHLRKTLEELK